MGKAVRAVTNVTKNLSPAGIVGGLGADKLLQKQGGVSGLAGSIADKATGLLGIGQPVDSGLTMSNFNIQPQAQKYEGIYDQQRADAQARSTAANSPALIAQLSKQAMGQGPSLAEAQLRSATNRNLSQQLAAAASMRGRNPAAAQRQILNAQGDAGRQLAEQSSVARLQEQNQAAQQLAQQQQMADNLQQNAAQQGFQTAIAPATMAQNYDLARAGIKAQNNQADKQLLGGVIGAGATLLSDENQKTAVRSGASKASNFLDTLSAKEFNYKPSAGQAPGKKVGVMAQDLEKSAVGKQMVKDTPTGKAIDVAQGLGAVLAATAEMNQRLKKLEGKTVQKMADGGFVDESNRQAQEFLGKLKGNKSDIRVDVKSPGKPEPEKKANNIGYGSAGEGRDLSMMAFSGGKVPGKAKVAGDSPKNDKVDVRLSPGEIVIPRTAAKSPEKAMKFVQQLFEQEMNCGGRVKPKKGY